MITVDITKVLQELQQYKEEVDRKLKHMVVGFSYIISEEAIKRTPLGDSHVYESWYIQRFNSTGLEPKEGYSRGSWQVNTSGQFSQQERYGYGSGDAALGLVKGSLGTYQLGQTIYIGNTAYYFQALDDNYSEQTQGLGIVKPTIDAITSTYQVDLKRLFDEG